MTLLTEMRVMRLCEVLGALVCVTAPRHPPSGLCHQAFDVRGWRGEGDLVENFNQELRGTSKERECVCGGGERERASTLRADLALKFALVIY